ncbi:MAG: ROK family protein [Ignavibacteria bacterium]|nr:ROK family protein [Ignavibacteria bacterium]
MYLGIDLGGTNLKFGILNKHLDLVFQSTKPTNAKQEPYELIQFIIKITKHLLSKHPEIKTIGMGAPGMVSKNGLIRLAPNLEGWQNIDIISQFKKEISLPFAVDNDSNTACLAELSLGAGNDIDNFIYITLGTGVGGTIVINKKIYLGQNGFAGEIGHSIIDYAAQLDKQNPYRTGILEEFIGRKQIIDFANKKMAENPSSILHTYPKTDPYFVSEAIEKYKDETACSIFEEIGTILGVALSSLINILDIPTIVIGGGISQAHKLLFDTALNTMQARVIPVLSSDLEIRIARFTKDAGIIGAALLGKALL